MNYLMSQLQTLLLQIPKGKVTSYKAVTIALKLRSYRQAGQLLHKNPDPDRFPCFKVVHTDGRLGGYGLGVKEKELRLSKEKIKINKGFIVNFKDIFYSF